MTAVSPGKPTLEEVDARIEAAAPERRSLAPGRARAHRLMYLRQHLISSTDEAAELGGPFESGLAALGVAQLESFPENLFWDLDFPAAQVLRQARAAQDPPRKVAEIFDIICRLQRLYGRETAIRFRYVHDFSYGYDWAKWVTREPAQGGAVGPFDLEFLRYMEGRAHELLRLIEAGDGKYPRLAHDGPRNPFVFSREPADEVRLLSELAQRGQLPVEAWRFDAQPNWDRPYAELRVACAGELGLLNDGAR